MPTDAAVTAVPIGRLELLKDNVAYEAHNVLLKAFRGALDMSEPGTRALIADAATVISARSREDQSRRAARHSNFAMATVLEARGVPLAEALDMTMPDDPVAKGMALRAPRLESGDVVKG